MYVLWKGKGRRRRIEKNIQPTAVSLMRISLSLGVGIGRGILVKGLPISVKARAV